MSEALHLKTGDRVVITCDDGTVPGTVILASPNGRSLMLAFEALLHGHAGKMPVLRGDDGVFRSLVGGFEIKLERTQ